MSREKQIEEMANDLRALDCLQHNPNYSIEYQRATGLYSLGYRKASDVAEEIFAKIEKLIIRRMIADSPLIDDRLITDIAELKKKYTESEKDK